jgi:predicted metallopeptidase
VDHFEQVFQLHFPDRSGSAEWDTLHALETDILPASPIKTFTITEVRTAINRLCSTKAPGYNLITGDILKQLPHFGILAITYVFNSILRTVYFPRHWKVSQIVTILKPGKPADVKTYRPISLLPILSKVFEKLFITRIHPIIQSTQFIPDHQFGVRRKHATIEQVHRITKISHRTLENNQYCMAAFLDISQAFDRVWHDGLLYKLKTFLPANTYTILQSYLMNRHFRTKYREAYSSLWLVLAGVPQGSVLRPLIYLIYTAELPTLATHSGPEYLKSWPKIDFLISSN